MDKLEIKLYVYSRLTSYDNWWNTKTGFFGVLNAVDDALFKNNPVGKKISDSVIVPTAKGINSTIKSTKATINNAADVVNQKVGNAVNHMENTAGVVGKTAVAVVSIYALSKILPVVVNSISNIFSKGEINSSDYKLMDEFITKIRKNISQPNIDKKQLSTDLSMLDQMLERVNGGKAIRKELIKELSSKGLIKKSLTNVI